MENAIRIRNKKPNYKKPDYTQDTAKYTLTDLSKKEMVMILQNREYEKHSGRQHTNIFFGCMIASFFIAIVLSRYHNMFISLACFIPVFVYFVLNHRRKQKIEKAVEDQLHKIDEEGPNEPI